MAPKVEAPSTEAAPKIDEPEPLDSFSLKADEVLDNPSVYEFETESNKGDLYNKTYDDEDDWVSMEEEGEESRTPSYDDGGYDDPSHPS